MLDLGGCLPKNMNGVRTTHTCELCGFEPKTKNKYREKQDHLVMKHFKEKIDKIFPHCRPYACPSGDCSFTGKDKQALLRHYTGKHGVLERYLREALAEMSIHLVPTESGTKRRSSVLSSSNGSPKLVKQAKLILSPIDPKDLLPTVPLPQNSRSSAEELRREVEALMASFQPQPLETPMVIRVPSQLQLLAAVPHQQQPGLQPKPAPSAGSLASLNGGSVKLQLPQQPDPAAAPRSLPPPRLLSNKPAPATPLLVKSVPQPLSLSALSSNPAELGPSLASQPIPLELLTASNLGIVTSVAAGSSPPPVLVSSSITLSSSASNVLENKEVMWGAGLGPAVVVEAADTLPITYIETADGSYAALLDGVDYDLLMPGSVNSLDAFRERQLDFCML